MIERALIEQVDGEFANVNLFAAYKEYRRRGLDVEIYEWGALKSGSLPLGPDTIVVGFVRSILAALNQMGFSAPENFDYPPSSFGFLGRRVHAADFKALRAMDWDSAAAAPLFVKPRSHHKAFTGHVVRRYRDLIATAHFDEGMPVWISEPIGVVSEWRAFVLHGKIVGLRQYAGAPDVFPDVQVVNAIKDAVREEVPVAYSIDVAVTPDGGTLLVEFNDSFALGAYGLRSEIYCDMQLARWTELTRVKSGGTT